MDRLDQELDLIVAEYRAAFPDLDPGADFMPKLWNSIETKRSFLFRLKRMSEVAVAAALAACFITGMFIAPRTYHESQLAGNYVDVLAEAQSATRLRPWGAFASTFSTPTSASTNSL